MPSVKINQDMLEKLRWYSAVLWSRVTILEMVAVAAMALSIGLHFYVVRPLDRLVEREQMNVLTMTASERMSPEPEQGTDSVRAFVDFLPALERREKQLMELHEVAVRHRVRLERIQFEMEGVDDLPVLRQKIRVQAQGAFPSQKPFLKSLLAVFPNLVIKSISLDERSDESGGAMDVALEAALYYRSAQGEQL